MRAFMLVVTMSCLGVPGIAAAQENPLAESLRAQYAGVSRNAVAAAEVVAEDLYDYRPAEGVRSFGELFGHVADYFYISCAAAAGTDNPEQGRDFEGIASKAELVAAITAGAEYCASVWADATDAWLLEVVPSMFGGEAPRVSMLTFNTSHTNEHYGNIVTYMRVNGLVPPSSMPQQ